MKALVALSIVFCTGLAFATLPAHAASDGAMERSVDRVTDQQDAKDDKKAPNPCKGITRSSTKKQKKACADFMQQQ